MIQADNLMIGNYIHRLDLISGEKRVEKILFLGEKATTTGPIKVVEAYEDLEPIPLDEKWLIDFGFAEKTFNWRPMVYSNGEIYVEPLFQNGYRAEGYWIVGLISGATLKQINKKLKHVNTLQNFNLLLTGKRLTK